MSLFSLSIELISWPLFLLKFFPHFQPWLPCNKLYCLISVLPDSYSPFSTLYPTYTLEFSNIKICLFSSFILVSPLGFIYAEGCKYHLYAENPENVQDFKAPMNCLVLVISRCWGLLSSMPAEGMIRAFLPVLNGSEKTSKVLSFRTMNIHF